jgi:hypothetical protein
MMKYSKREVNTLGQAEIVIEQTGAKNGHFPDALPRMVNPAYDLDE